MIHLLYSFLSSLLLFSTANQSTAETLIFQQSSDNPKSILLVSNSRGVQLGHTSYRRLLRTFQLLDQGGNVNSYATLSSKRNGTTELLLFENEIFFGKIEFHRRTRHYVVKDATDNILYETPETSPESPESILLQPIGSSVDSQALLLERSFNSNKPGANLKFLFSNVEKPSFDKRFAIFIAAFEARKTSQSLSQMDRRKMFIELALPTLVSIGMGTLVYRLWTHYSDLSLDSVRKDFDQNQTSIRNKTLAEMSELKDEIDQVQMIRVQSSASFLSQKKAFLAQISLLEKDYPRVTNQHQQLTKLVEIYQNIFRDISDDDINQYLLKWSIVQNKPLASVRADYERLKPTRAQNQLRRSKAELDRLREVDFQFQKSKKTINHFKHSIDSLRATIQTLKNDLQTKTREIKDRDLEIHTKNQQILTNDREIQRANQAIQDKDSEIRNKRFEVIGKTQDILHLAKKLRKRLKQIRDKDQQIHARDQQIHARDQQIQIKDQQIHLKNRDLTNKDQEIQKRDQKIKEKDERIFDLEDDLQTEKDLRVGDKTVIQSYDDVKVALQKERQEFLDELNDLKAELAILLPRMRDLYVTANDFERGLSPAAMLANSFRVKQYLRAVDSLCDTYGQLEIVQNLD